MLKTSTLPGVLGQPKSFVSKNENITHYAVPKTHVFNHFKLSLSIKCLFS